MQTPAQLGILVGTKGRGSNMRAIALACAGGEIPAEVRIVVAPSDAAPALEAAKELDLETRVAPPTAEDLLDAFEGCDILCLAGFMRLVPVEVLHAFPDCVLNIHPALLPKYGGKGMYGHHVHQAVIDAGEEESGCTVHLVNERYDEGAIVLQLRCPVFPGDTPEDLAARVLELEHKAYPMAIKELIQRDEC